MVEKPTKRASGTTTVAHRDAAKQDDTMNPSPDGERKRKRIKLNVAEAPMLGNQTQLVARLGLDVESAQALVGDSQRKDEEVADMKASLEKEQKKVIVFQVLFSKAIEKATNATLAEERLDEENYSLRYDVKELKAKVYKEIAEKTKYQGEALSAYTQRNDERTENSKLQKSNKEMEKKLKKNKRLETAAKAVLAGPCNGMSETTFGPAGKVVDELRKAMG